LVNNNNIIIYVHAIKIQNSNYIEDGHQIKVFINRSNSKITDLDPIFRRWKHFFINDRTICKLLLQLRLES